MKKIISLFLLMVVTAYGATPITGLKLGGNADGNQKSFTNFYALELGGETRTNWPTGGETTWESVTGKPTLVTNVVVTGGYLTESGTAQKSIGLTRAAIVSAISGQILDAGSFTNLNETDPAWAAVSNTVTAGAAAGATALQPGASGTSTNLTDYNNDAGFLTAETDPVWISQSNLIQEMAENGQTAYGWGDHGTNGYLTAETDPIWGAVSNTVTTNAANGQTAYGWGNHALQGYKDFAQGTNIVPLVSLSGITSNQIDSTTDAAYRTGGGGSGFPLTENGDLAGYSLTNGNDVTVTNALSGKTLTVTETITINKSGGGIVQGKSGTGNSLILKQDDGELNMIELGRNTVVGVGVAPTGVVIVAHGGLAPVNVIASSFGVHAGGSTTNFVVTSAGAVRIGANMNANNQAITNMKYSVTRTNATAIAPAAGTKAIYDIIVSGTWYKREVINLGGTITTNLWKLN